VFLGEDAFLDQPLIIEKNVIIGVLCDKSREYSILIKENLDFDIAVLARSRFGLCDTSLRFEVTEIGNVSGRLVKIDEVMIIDEFQNLVEEANQFLN